MKRALALASLLLATAAGAARVEVATKHAGLPRAPRLVLGTDADALRAAAAEKAQWAPSSPSPATAHASRARARSAETASGISLAGREAAAGQREYAYARVNPLRYTDPTGHCWFVPGSGDVACVRLGVDAYQRRLLSDYAGQKALLSGDPSSTSMVGQAIASAAPVRTALGFAHVGTAALVVTTGYQLDPATIEEARETVNMANPAYAAHHHFVKALEADAKAKAEGRSLKNEWPVVQHSVEFALNVAALGAPLLPEKAAATVEMDTAVPLSRGTAKTVVEGATGSPRPLPGTIGDALAAKPRPTTQPIAPPGSTAIEGPASSRGDVVQNAKRVGPDDVRGGDFRASRKKALEKNEGVCEYCQERPATQGDHFDPVKEGARRVNEGELTLEEAVKEYNAAENVVGACGGKGGCNPVKGGRLPGSQPGPGKFVPKKPTQEVLEKIIEYEARKRGGS